jgi:CubicO group peptidase (beta-lactamase class C family)
LTELRPPETDCRVVIAEVGQVADARSAAAAAWRAWRGKETHPFKLLAPMTSLDGWDEMAVVEYETSPSEHKTVVAYVFREGRDWVALVLDGSASTVEKRLAPLTLILQSLRPPGYKRESFAGRTAHRLEPRRVEALVDFVREAAAKLDVPGVGLALIDHGEIVFEGGVGSREMGRPEKIDANTRFMVASNTKGMATLLLARLVDQGKLGWDDPVTEVYPSFRLGDDETTRQVLIRHLVSAYTGLPRKDIEALFTTTAETPAESTFDLLAATQPTSRFGEVFQYNNQMAAAAGYVAGHVAYPDREVGEAFDTAMQALIFNPLGMNETTFSMAEAVAGNHASPHGMDLDGELRVLGMAINDTVMPFRPAGGAWSTPHDMILYVQNELAEGMLPDGGRLMAPENLLARRRRGAPVGEDHWYGMGLMEDATWGVSVIHHGGDLPGYHSDIFAIPSAQVGAVILTNADYGASLRRPFLRRLLELLYDGREEAASDVSAAASQFKAQRLAEREKLNIPAARADVSGLASAYANASLGRLAIEQDGGVVRVRTPAWSSEVASRRNEDGTVSLITIDPAVLGLGFEVGAREGRPTLTVRDAQHVYEFAALD